MNLRLEHGANRDPHPLLAVLTAAGAELDDVVRKDTWPDDLELQASGDLDGPRLERTVLAAAADLCPREISIRIRIVRDANDLLYHVPCDDSLRAVAGLVEDITSYDERADPFRTWFRGKWMGTAEEWALSERELASAPLTADRILKFLDPPEFRDWRPIQQFVQRHAACRDLVEAMAAAKTATQKWRLAYAFHYRRRSCEAAIPLLIGWLRDPDATVREEAADSLGRLVLALRFPSSRIRWGEHAGAALLAYVNQYTGDNLYFARTALGATGYEPARRYLEQLARTATGQARESATRALANLDEASRVRGRRVQAPDTTPSAARHQR